MQGHPLGWLRCSWESSGLGIGTCVWEAGGEGGAQCGCLVLASRLPGEALQLPGQPSPGHGTPCTVSFAWI